MSSLQTDLQKVPPFTSEISDPHGVNLMLTSPHRRLPPHSTTKHHRRQSKAELIEFQAQPPGQSFPYSAHAPFPATGYSITHQSLLNSIASSHLTHCISNKSTLFIPQTTVLSFTASTLYSYSSSQLINFIHPLTGSVYGDSSNLHIFPQSVKNESTATISTWSIARSNFSACTSIKPRSKW